MNMSLTAFALDGFLEHSQSSESSSVGNLQADPVFARVQRQHPLGSLLVWTVQSGEAERERDWLEPRCL